MLSKERNRIADSGPGGNIKYSLTLEVNDEQLNALSITTLVIERKYLTAKGDYLYVDALFLQQDVKKIYTYRANLKCTLSHTFNNTKYSQEFKVVLGEANHRFKNESNLNSHSKELAKEPPIMLSLQLIDWSTLILDSININPFSIEKDSTIEDMLTSAWARTKKDVDKVHKDKVKGELKLILSKPDNMRKYPNLMASNGNTIFKLIKDSQVKSGQGIYNGGICIYLQKVGRNNLLHVFPPFRLDRTSKILKVFSLSNVEVQTLKNTYIDSSSALEILVGDIDAIDDRMHERIINKGNAIDIVDADTMMKRPYIKKENGDVDAKKDNIRIKHVHELKKDGIVRPAKSQLTNNLYDARSHVLSEQGSKVTVTWRSSNPDIITPGMGCTFIHINMGNDIEELNGVVLGTYTAYDEATKNCLTLIHMFVENYKQK